MTFKQLEYFFAINLFGSVTKAATSLGVSTPTITHAIHQLEQEVGIPLYTNGSRYRELTPAGQAILEHANIIMQNHSALNRSIAAFQRGRNHIIKFAFFLGDEIPLQITRVFNRMNPTLQVNMEQNGAHLITSGVNNKEYDIGVTATCTVDPNLVAVPYSSVEFGILVSNTHPLSEHESIPASLLENQVVAVPEFDPSVENSFTSYCSKQKVNAIIQRLPCGVYAKNAIVFRREVACIFPVTTENLSNDFSFRRLNPPLYLEQSMVWRKDLHIDKDIRNFIDFLFSNRPKNYLITPK